MKISRYNYLQILLTLRSADGGVPLSCAVNTA